jgi:hypothetical protein
MKHTEYAGKIALHLSEIFNEGNPNHISQDELMDIENLKQFMFALTTLVPNTMYNVICAVDYDVLHFNHLCNALIFEYGKLEDNEKADIQTV